MSSVSRASEIIAGASAPSHIPQENTNASELLRSDFINEEQDEEHQIFITDFINEEQAEVYIIESSSVPEHISPVIESASAPEHIPPEIENASELLRGDFIYKKQDEEHKIDISEHFLKSVHDQVSSHRKVHTIPCTIYRVPPEIRSTHPEAYTPKAVCIGPFFYSERNGINLRQMQDYKWTCVSKLIPNDNSSRSLQVCLAEMKKLDKRIRASYSDEINMKNLSSDELAEMMLLDGCFILHLLLKHSEGAEISTTEVIDEDGMQVIGRCWIWNLVTYDLLLLENQIPFFVILHLFVLIKNNYRPCNLDDPQNLDKPGKDLVACSLRLFSSIHPHRADASFSDRYRQVHHLLHLFDLSIPQCAQPTKSSRDGTLEEIHHWIPSAKELQDAGVEFKKRKNASSFLDIKFRKGAMEIPPLEVHDYSNSLFRNLIAFEQCYPDTPCQITVYAAFMDCLLNTPEDTRLLHLSGILTNRMTTDQDAAHFFSRLCNQVHYATDNSYLRDLCVEVNKYQGLRRHKWRAALVRDYFSSPWVIISFLAAIFLLLLTAGQTFYTIYPFYHK
ncbi:UPF0481 protein At3g47200-like [Typha angustifolia]|uniref:UPF0481 protein At3g47200-like n=1 Tax=Typha angustifolia TaxID=59011 RepID=UPI003C2EB5CC